MLLRSASWQDEPLSSEIKGSGFYVVRSQETALWALYRANTFEGGGLLAVNLGDDSETTAAVYGQLAGALWGEGGIPDEWLSRQALRDEISQLACRLYEHAATSEASLRPT